jgi:hypothetical protein
VVGFDASGNLRRASQRLGHTLTWYLTSSTSVAGCKLLYSPISEGRPSVPKATASSAAAPPMYRLSFLVGGVL